MEREQLIANLEMVYSKTVWLRERLLDSSRIPAREQLLAQNQIVLESLKVQIGLARDSEDSGD